MNIPAHFIHRPVATTLLTIAIIFAGLVALRILPVAPLPQIDFPTILVRANLPGASPEVMAATVAMPLERSLGRIAGVNEITSSNSLGATNIVLQFDLSRNIDGAARDVQAAINAARSLLPSGLPNNPTYRKVNPADAPIMIIALTSETMSKGQLYDAASSILAQKLSQINGIGQVTVGGAALPAVRIELNPDALNKYGISLEQVRTAIAATNPTRPLGVLEDQNNHWQIYANDQAKKAADYISLIVAFRNNAPVRISDIGTAVDGMQDLRNAGSANGKQAISLVIFKQPSANIIETVDKVHEMLPQLKDLVPAAVNMEVMMDRTTTIRASLLNAQKTLLISIILVITVVFLFLRSSRATLIPSLAIPVSLIGTFAIMYLFNYTLDNLSLISLTIATGFVVDDAIVVLENISRHIENGETKLRAALLGAKEVGFTVISMSISLIAVFIPIILMGDIVGRLFREFAITLCATILISLFISLSATPMLCSKFLKDKGEEKHNRFHNICENIFNKILEWYKAALNVALDNKFLVLIILFCTIILNIYLYIIVPKGFFPRQDTGRIMGNIQADQNISFQSMKKKLDDFMSIIRSDEAVENVVGFTGGGQRNTGNMFIMLKPFSKRDISSDEVIARLRKKLAKEPGAKLFLQSAQDIRMGGRQSGAQYQYTLQSDDLNLLRKWAPIIYKEMLKIPIISDVNTDQQDNGLQTSIFYDRDTLYRLNLNPSLIDATLNDAFGQRLVSNIYNPLNQYHVVMEVAPKYWQNSDILKSTYVTNSTGATIPLSAFSSYKQTNTPLAVNHQGQFAASTISFNLPIGVSLGEASDAIKNMMLKIHVPESVQGSFQGTAQAFQNSVNSLPFLILVSIITIYIVLGILYESYIHPITILSTLPSAGIGAILALIIFKTDFTIIAFIGVILLIGIVKKNAIMMIDVAINVERSEGLSAREAIYKACVLRFRPIMMTTMSALLGAMPLAFGIGEGTELSRPLGISIASGLIVSQILTLFTTPVVYLYFDSLEKSHHVIPA